MATVGGTSAILELGAASSKRHLSLAGFASWVAWRSAYLTRLGSLRNRWVGRGGVGEGLRAMVWAVGDNEVGGCCCDSVRAFDWFDPGLTAILAAMMHPQDDGGV